MSLKSRLCSALVIWLCISALAQKAPNPKAVKALNRGIAEFEKERYQEAVSILTTTVQQDPNSAKARLYLAKALAGLYDPLLPTPENAQYASRASEQYRELLRKNPQDVESLKGFATLMTTMHKPDEARRFYGQALKVSPGDADLYKRIGFVDFDEAGIRVAETRQNNHFKYTDSPIMHGSCGEARAIGFPLLNASIENFSKAFALVNDDETAASYLSWAYEKRADLECNDLQTRNKDMEQGKKWMQLAAEAHKKNPKQPPPLTLVKL